MRRPKLVLDLLLIFVFTAVLIKPLFKLKYLDRWDSIESSFISDARFLKDHWPHPQWQPLWYSGTRTDYIYPPVLQYGTALLSRWWIPAKAYHIYTALFYCLGIAGVYFMVWVMSCSRVAAWLAAAAAALVSPLYLLIPLFRADTQHFAPWRLWVLTRFGEGPHISVLSLLPFALAFAFVALRRWNPAATALAAIFSAAAVSTNFYGATALGILFPVLVSSVWITQREARVWLRAAAIAALSYGLCAFWLVPSYLRLTQNNLKWFSLPGDPVGQALNIAAWIIFAMASRRAANRQPQRAYATFLAGGALILGVNVLGIAWFHVKALAEPDRLAPEFDLVLILAGVEILRRLWTWRPAVPRQTHIAQACAALVVLLAAGSARHYIRHAWEIYPADHDYQSRVEYRLSDWMWRNMPQARAMVTGSVRFWWTAWHDLPEITGAMERGVSNPYLVPGLYEITAGRNPELAVDWLAALGADAVIVNDKNSQEPYHDFVYPYKFTGLLPVLYDDHQGNVIYRVPRRYPAIARVVDAAGFRKLHPLTPQTDLQVLRAYYAAIEQGPDVPTIAAWDGTDRLRLHARVSQGQAVVVQVTYDPAWRAYAGGKSMPVHRDAAGLSLIEAPPGEYDIAFRFETPLENRIGRVLTWLSLAIAAALLAALAGRRRGAA